MKFLGVTALIIVIFIWLLFSEGRGNLVMYPKIEEPASGNVDQRGRTDEDDSDPMRNISDDMLTLDEEKINKKARHGLFELDLPPNYNKYQIPKDKDGSPIQVYIQLTIRKILDFDELAENIKMDVELHVLWTDYKIRDVYNADRAQKHKSPRTIESLTPAEVKNMTVTLNNPHVLDSVWTPNLFFANLLEVKQPSVMSKPVRLKIIPEVGSFEYLTRLIAITDCPMEFEYYPADTQICKFGIRAFSYTKKDLLLSWYKHGVWLHELSLYSFDIQVDDLREIFLLEDENDPNSEEFDVLAFNIHTRRKLSYHLVQTYITSTFYIIITCLCFLLPPRFVEARIGISMTTLLTLTAMFAAVRGSTPIVSYVKAIDIWMVGCIIFVFLTMTEFSFHTWLQAKKEEHEINHGKKQDTELVPFTSRNVTDNHDDGNLKTVEFQNRKSSNSKKSKTLEIEECFHKKKAESYSQYMSIMEKYSFPFFIIVITICTTLYWSWLLMSSEYFNWDVNETNNNVHRINLEQGF